MVVLVNQDGAPAASEQRHVARHLASTVAASPLISTPMLTIPFCLSAGDVKYHLGTSYDRPTISGKRVHLSLVANPSHLEAVNTVVLGKTRAKQFYTGDEDRTRNMAVLLHGDGSFAGQGIVMETLDMSKLPNYSVGGTIHIVVNNQVSGRRGASDRDARSGGVRIGMCQRSARRSGEGEEVGITHCE